MYLRVIYSALQNNPTFLGFSIQNRARREGRKLPKNHVKSTIFSSIAYANVGSLSCLLYTSPSPRDRTRSRMPSSA